MGIDPKLVAKVLAIAHERLFKDRRMWSAAKSLPLQSLLEHAWLCGAVDVLVYQKNTRESLEEDLDAL